MFNKLKYYVVILFTIIIISSCTSKKRKPNIIYILADDLGYGDVGAYGQNKIETPNIDALAENGIKFTQHYAGAPVSAPSRCVLLTGRNMGHSYIRGNDEWDERGDIWNFEKVVNEPSLEGQRPLADSIKTVGNILQSEGYTTGIVGKWGLGAPETNSTPNDKGFDFFYGFNCQRQAHTYYPKHLWKNKEKVILDNKLVPPYTKLSKEADPYKEESYAQYNLTDYAPTLMHREALNFIKENKEKPFFLLYASPIPHVPLQAPKKWVDYYVNKFGNEEPYLGNKGYFPCRYPKATYAAMISYLDEQVGEIVKLLKEEGIYENTIIMFTSDNGPAFSGGVDSEFFNSGGLFNNGFGWGKGFLREGGVRIPMIVSWQGHVKQGTTTNHISGFWDVLPTFCDILGIETPTETDGTSFLPTLLGEKQKQPEYIYYEFPEYDGQQSVRIGDMKAFRQNMQKGNLELKLYNLKDDITEEKDIAEDNPELIQKIEKIMKEEHQVPKLDAF